jgi:uncharacterized protein
MDKRGFEPVTVLAALAALGAGTAFFGPAIRQLLSGPVLQTWVTILLAVVIQATPFLVLGVVVSSALAAFVSPEALARMAPRRSGLAVPAAALAGVALPGCECSSVIIAGRLVSSGTPSGAAVAFLVAAPAVNPVVIAATAVAFPGNPRIVIGRFVASLLTAILVGLIWSRVHHEDRAGPACSPPRAEAGAAVFTRTFVDDFVTAMGFLVLGAAATATLQVTAGPSILRSLSVNGFLAVPAMATLAVLLCVCSEADAFVAATFTQFSTTARLAFMVVGPAVDMKLIALEVGTFGGAFTARFAPLTFVVALVSSVIVGAILR